MTFWWRKRREFRAELDSHVQMATQDRTERGEDPARARQHARRDLGNEALIRETTRDQWGFRWLESLLQDLRFGFRTLRKSPGFTLVAVLTLALGIGSVTLIFSAVYGVILNTFPFRDADQVTSFDIQDLSRPTNYRESLSMPEFLYFREHSQAFQDFSGEYGGFGTSPVRYTTGKSTYQFDADFVSVNSFRFFGVEPLLGRLPTPEDVRSGATPVFVMGAKLWRGEFNGDPKILGKSFTLNGVPTTLVGIMPQRFRWAWVDVWVPFSVEPAVALTNPDLKNRFLYTVGRLKPGVILSAAAADLNRVAHQYAKIAPADYPKRFTVSCSSLADRVTGGFKRLMYPLLVAVLMLLLIACSNIANLLLSRATVREREIAIRASLGASPSRLVRQLLVESMLLATAGGLMGCLFAWVGIKGVVPLVPYNLFPQEAVIALNGPVLGAALIVALFSTLLCGIAPAVYAARADIRTQLAGNARASGFRHGKLRSALVIAEVSLAIVLTVGAGLMMRTFWNIKNLNLGFDPGNVLSAQLSFPQTGGQQQTREQEEQEVQKENIASRKVLDGLGSLPGVLAVALVSNPPLYGDFGSPIDIPGRSHSQHWKTLIDLCSERYFGLLRLRLLNGRVFSQGDVDLARPVTVISRAFANRYFGSANPIGQSVHFVLLDQVPKWKGALFQIVGVVSDVRNDDPRNAPAPEAYLPYTIGGPDGTTLLVRSLLPPASLIPTIRERAWHIDSNIALVNPQTLPSVLKRDVFSSPHFEFVILATFAAIALALLMAGIFSVMAYTISLRTHEIGIRIALGARPEGILRMVLGKGIRLAAVGIVIGVAACFATMKFLRAFLFGVRPTDPITFVTVSILIVVAALLACWIPARRAMRVDPIVALRHE
ncbi:MAG TPA: ABC transporter permease [Candidatus Acidoferrales bacterium]|nr:ABC transporter permease [Candidatus Acidoferrales bacterium]